jgi:hypothetical protein
MTRLSNAHHVGDADSVPWLKLMFAMAVSPAVPMAWIAMQTTGTLWAPFVYLWGYLTFILTGMPLAAFAYVRGTLLACVACGGFASILPLLLLASLSMFSTMHMTDRTVIDMLSLFVAGGLGGAVFWLILFSQIKVKG